ncbi:MAG: hypothetical protein ACRDFB_09610 [Rhabdochlamydiaceae bacterium]
MNFISAKEGPPNYGDQFYTVQYFDEKGNMTIRSGGTKAWRNNNPGNMKYAGGFAARHGAIGEAGKMAVFPTEAVGQKALIDLLKSSNYNNFKVGELSEKYDKDNAQEYRRMILSISKLDPNKRVRDLNAKEFDQLREAVERIEGWEVGKEDFIQKWYISGVHKKHGIITEYLIDKAGKQSWIAKEGALKLAKEGKFHATIVHLKNGTVYLRPEFGNRPFTQVV